MKLRQHPLLIGAITGPFLFLLLSLGASVVLQAIWHVQSWDTTTQILNAAFWGALLGAVTFHSYANYKQQRLIQAKQLCLMVGAVLSLLFTIGLAYRFWAVSHSDVLAQTGFSINAPSAMRWLAVAFLESIALQWALVLLIVGLWLPKHRSHPM